MPRHARLPHRGPGDDARRRRSVRWPRLALLGLGLLSLLALAACSDMVYQAVVHIPNVTDPTGALGVTSMIYDRQGNPVTPVPGLAENRQPVDLSQVPPLLQDAFIATEDRSFYTNIGISFRGIARALLVDLRHGFSASSLQGGSTISQQLARNLYLSPQDTLTRKLREAALAIDLNRRYTKRQILAMYLNEVDLGEHAYGVEAAAETYFDQPDLSRLTLPQMALLAGLPQAPSAYDPLLHPQAALIRRNEVIASMLAVHDITAAQAAAARAAPLGLDPGPPPTGAAYPDPWFVDAVILTLEQPPYNLTWQQISEGGLKIYTTLDPAIEAAAVQAVQTRMQGLGTLQAAEVVMDQSTGDVVAIVGGVQHTTALGFDRAITPPGRQPGSSLKPIVDYIPALEHGLTAGTVVDDVIHAYGTYLPQDDQPPYYGLTTLTEALRRSVNTVAVQILNRVGIQTGYDNAVAMGLPLTSQDKYLPLAIGGTADCCTPLEMADAYAAIANGGMRVTPRLITQVVGPQGQVLFSNPPRYQRVIDPRVAFVMTKMLETVASPQPNTGWDVTSGPNDSNWATGYDAQVQDNVPGWPTAGKTGTTDNNEDAWFVGYTPLYTAAVWVGYDNHQPFKGLYGGVYAGPIFRQTMTAAVAGHSVEDFPQPAGVVQAPIDIRAAPWTVAKPGPLTPPQDVRQEWFVAGTQPTAVSPLWVQRTVDSVDPQTLWAPGCPGAPEVKVFLNRTVLGRSWAAPIAFAKGTADWQQFLPLDLSLAPPTQTCFGTPAAAGTGAPAGGAAPVPATAGPAPACASTWVVTLDHGQPMAPATVCAPAGRALTLTFAAGDGRRHTVRITAFRQRVNVPADGTPVTVVFTPNRSGSFVMGDALDPAETGRLVIQAGS